jgi:hypothetical protein
MVSTRKLARKSPLASKAKLLAPAAKAWLQVQMVLAALALLAPQLVQPAALALH